MTEDAFKQALEEGEPERVLAALQQGADVSMEIDFGRERRTPLAYCILKGREDLAALLLEHGAPIREDEAKAYCRFLRLRKNTQGSLSLLQLLLEKGLDPAIELRWPMMGRSRLTPVLLWIARDGMVRHLELLCRAGADLTLTAQGGINVLMAAFDGNGRHADIEKIDFIDKQGLRLWHATTQDNDYNLYRFVHNAEDVQLLLNHGVDFNHVDADGLTPLVWAARNQNAAGAELLMRAGALVAPKEASMGERESLFRGFLGLIKTPLWQGPQYVDTQLSEQLISLILAQTLHAEERRRVCNLALLAACAQKRRDLIDYCLSEGADIHTSTDGFSLLGFVFAQPASFRVVNKRDKQVEKELIAYLLERGAEINCRAFGVQPVLQTAVVSKVSPEVVELLLAHGADKSQAIRTAVSFEDIEILKRLLAEQPMDRDLLYKALLGRTPREFAARRGTAIGEGLRKLCAQGMIELTENDTDALGIPIASVLWERQTAGSSQEPDKSRNRGSAHARQQILLTEEEYEAVKQHIALGNEDFIREMLDKDPLWATAVIEIHGERRRRLYSDYNALILAASSVQPEICRILVESCDVDGLILKAAIDALHKTEDSPAKTEVLKILLEYTQHQQINVERSLLYDYGHPWSDEHVSLFLEYGSAAVAAEHGGATFLHQALVVGYYPLVRQLVRLGCSLEACTDNGYTCLHWACRGGNADCVRLCIEAGLDVHSTIITPQGDKVPPVSLFWEKEKRRKARRDRAREKGYTSVNALGKDANPNPETLELLLQHGVSPDWTDASGATMLMHAIRTSHSAEMVQMLLQHGADVHLRDREGNTPLMIAALEQEDEICRLLMEAGASLEDRNNAGCTAMAFARLMQETQEPGEDEES